MDGESQEIFADALFLSKGRSVFSLDKRRKYKPFTDVILRGYSVELEHVFLPSLFIVSRLRLV